MQLGSHRAERNRKKRIRMAESRANESKLPAEEIETRRNTKRCVERDQEDAAWEGKGQEARWLKREAAARACAEDDQASFHQRHADELKRIPLGPAVLCDRRTCASMRPYGLVLPHLFSFALPPMPDISLVLASLSRRESFDSFDYTGMPALESPTISETDSIPSLHSLSSDDSDTESAHNASTLQDAYSALGLPDVWPVVIALPHTDQEYWGVPSLRHSYVRQDGVGDLQVGEVYARANYSLWSQIRTSMGTSLALQRDELLAYLRRVSSLTPCEAALEEERQVITSQDPVSFHDAVHLERSAERLAILNRGYAHIGRERLRTWGLASFNTLAERLRQHTLRIGALVSEVDAYEGYVDISMRAEVRRLREEQELLTDERHRVDEWLRRAFPTSFPDGED
ncbi:hypothetical protein C8J57DRAFT_1219547 [Mycena rebaudengoi]|nr:hypothetical protein C8J57DRAFT_1219547 [Mycena rebaudengoi]